MDRHDLLGVTDDDAKREHERPSDGAVFVVSNRPVVPERVNEHVQRSTDYDNLGELPRFYGRPVLFGIARDPHTLFAYWEIDWKNVFGDKPPMDRKVYLFVTSADGSENIRVAVEPFAGNHTIAVSQARTTYRIELGYYEPGEKWRSIITSGAIATPPNNVSASGDIDVATIPQHLNFQRMVDTLRGSKYDRDALVQIVARLQKGVDDSAETTLTEADHALLQAIEPSLSQSEKIERGRLRGSQEAFTTRQQIESILGFGGSSPM